MAMQTPIFFTDVGAQNELLPPEFLIPNTAPLAQKFADAICNNDRFFLPR
jgi:hypothetical protein